MFVFKYPLESVEKEEHLNVMVRLRTEKCQYTKTGQNCPIKERSQKKTDCSQHDCFYYHSDSDKRRCPITNGNVEVYRPALCKFFKPGSLKCKFQDNCRYAHGYNELVFHPSIYKTQMCRYFLNNLPCDSGEYCCFAHGESDLRQPSELIEIHQNTPTSYTPSLPRTSAYHTFRMNNSINNNTVNNNNNNRHMNNNNPQQPPQNAQNPLQQPQQPQQQQHILYNYYTITSSPPMLPQQQQQQQQQQINPSSHQQHVIIQSPTNITYPNQQQPPPLPLPPQQQQQQQQQHQYTFPTRQQQQQIQIHTYQLASAASASSTNTTSSTPSLSSPHGANVYEYSYFNSPSSRQRSNSTNAVITNNNNNNNNSNSPLVNNSNNNSNNNNRQSFTQPPIPVQLLPPQMSCSSSSSIPSPYYTYDYSPQIYCIPSSSSQLSSPATPDRSPLSSNNGMIYTSSNESSSNGILEGISVAGSNSSYSNLYYDDYNNNMSNNITERLATYGLGDFTLGSNISATVPPTSTVVP